MHAKKFTNRQALYFVQKGIPVNHNFKTMPVVLLAGGLGTRIREETEFKPKPMVEIGGRPILWHIMKHLSTYGFEEFIICLGYKGDYIRQYFLNYQLHNSDFTIDLSSPNQIHYHSDLDESEWKITLVETGAETLTGGRVLQCERYIGGRNFLVTYGDGVSNIEIPKLFDTFVAKGKIATVTAVRPISRFGTLGINESGIVTSFLEKPMEESWINGGYFMFTPKVFKYLNLETSLESEPLASLTNLGELSAYKHDGFWQPMDTYREAKLLNDLWSEGIAPWRNW
jgi:glucose-1-phosphate cytidylyltransferase